MQKCKINKLSCCGCDKKTSECYSIENCQHKVVCMNKLEALEIMEKIKDECSKHEQCDDCPFFIKYKSKYDDSECVLAVAIDQCDDPRNIDYKKLILEGEE